MRVGVLVAALAAALLAAAPVVAFREARRPTPGGLLSAGGDGRSVLVGYGGGGCAYEATPRVRESSEAVRITLLQRVAIPEGDEMCDLRETLYRLRVRLRVPLAGRRVLLEPSSRIDPFGFGFLPEVHLRDGWTPIVPRLVGLAPPDATRLLRDGQVRYRVRCHRARRPRPVVIAQWPAVVRRVTALRRPRLMRLWVSCRWR